MKCPKCKDIFPKGNQYCLNCGTRPVKKRRWAWVVVMVATPIIIGFLVWMLTIMAKEDDGVGIIFVGLVIVLWARLAVHIYQWLRWTRPVDSDKTAASDSGQSSS